MSVVKSDVVLIYFRQIRTVENGGDGVNDVGGVGHRPRSGKPSGTPKDEINFDCRNDGARVCALGKFVEVEWDPVDHAGNIGPAQNAAIDIDGRYAGRRIAGKNTTLERRDCFGTSFRHKDTSIMS